MGMVKGSPTLRRPGRSHHRLSDPSLRIWRPNYDDLVDGKEQPIDVCRVGVSINGVELQARDFIAAIHEGREPNASVGKVLDCYRAFADLEIQLAG